MKTNHGPQTNREVSLYSAGMYRGMKNYAMAMAAARSGSARAELVKAARSFHHTYIARLKEAAGASGYRAPVEVEVSAASYELPPVTDGWMSRKQAGGV